MSAPLKSVSKTVDIANKQLEQAKEQVKRYESIVLNSNRAIDQARNQLTELSKEQNINSKQIEKAQETLARYQNTVGLTEKQIANYARKAEEAKSKLLNLEQAQELNNSAMEEARKIITDNEEVLGNNSEALKRAREQVRSYSRSISENSKVVNDARKKVEEWGNAALNSMDQVVKRSFQVGAAIATAVSGFSIKTGIGEAMDMEGYKMQLETATKSTEKAGKLMAQSIEFANSTPFETGEVVEATAKMEAYGISSERWLKDVADMAGATNKSIDQATEAMADAVMGEWERLKEFGIKKEQLVAAAAAKYGKNVVFNKKGQVRDQIKLETILQEEMQKKFAGGAEKQAKTLKGLWSTITGVTKTSLATIVGITNEGTIRQGSLFDMLKGHIETVVEVLNRWHQDGTIQRIAEQVTQAIGSMINFFTELFEFVNKHRALIESILVFVGSIYLTVKAIMALKAALTVLSVVMAVLNGTIMLTPLGWLVLIIGAVATAFYLLKNHMDVIIGAFEKVADVGRKAFDYVKKLFNIEDKDVNLAVKKDEEQNIDTNINKKIEEVNNNTGTKGLGAQQLPVLKNEPKNTFREVKKQDQIRTGESSKAAQPQISVVIQGDVYGFNDFKEKVAEAVVKIYEQNKSNVVR